MLEPSTFDARVDEVGMQEVNAMLYAKMKERGLLYGKSDIGRLDSEQPKVVQELFNAFDDLGLDE